MSTRRKVSWKQVDRNTAALAIILLVYIVLGLYTHLIFVRTHPDYDFQFYDNALSKALAGSDPYDIRRIGPAFLYPPPSLFAIEALRVAPNPLLRRYLFLVVNLAILLFVIRQISAYFGYSLRQVWFWFPLGFFFAPFLATLLAGQINLITEFGIVLFFVSTQPWLAGLGLALAAVTKVTPLALLFYSLIRRDLRTIMYSLLVLLVVILAAGLRYGFPTYTAFVDAFHDLLGVFPISQNSQSFVSKVWMLFAPSAPPAPFHRLFLIYLALLVLASGVLAVRTRDAVPLFVVLGLAVTVSPNIMWYHHYVFLLPPLFIWMAWRKLENSVTLWIISGLLIAQIDYYFLTTGLLIHLFVQLSILRVIYQQYSKLQEFQLQERVSVV